MRFLLICILSVGCFFWGMFGAVQDADNAVKACDQKQTMCLYPF